MSTLKSKEKGGQPIPLEAIDQARIKTNIDIFGGKSETLQYTYNQNGLTLLLGPVAQELIRQGLETIGNLVVTRREGDVEPLLFTPTGFEFQEIIKEPLVVISGEKKRSFKDNRLKGKMAETVRLRGLETKNEYTVHARQWGWLPHEGSHR